MKNKGMSLAIIILVAALLFGMAAVATNSVRVAKSQALDVNINEQCRYAANGGLQRGLLELATNGSLVQFTDPPQNPPPVIDEALATDSKLRYHVELLANGTPYMIQAPDGSDIPPGAVYIHSVGYLDGTNYRVSASGFSALAVRAKPMFDYAALTDAQIRIQADSLVDAWNSSSGPYSATFNPLDPSTWTRGARLATNMGTSNAINVAGNTAIDGDLLVSPDVLDPTSIINTAGSVILAGQESNMLGNRRIPLWETALDTASATQSVAVPAGTNQVLAPGPYRSLVAGSANGGRTTLVLQPGEYYFDQSIDLTNTDVVVDSSAAAEPSDPVIVYVKGNFSTDNSVVNLDMATTSPGTPRKFQVYFTGSDRGLNVTAGSQVHMVASGSSTRARVSDSEVFGAIMARDMVMSGAGAKLHYDRALEGLALEGVGKWALNGVKEKSGRTIGGGNNGGNNGGSNGGVSNGGGNNGGVSNGGGSNGGGSNGWGSNGGVSNGGGSNGWGSNGWGSNGWGSNGGGNGGNGWGSNGWGSNGGGNGGNGWGSNGWGSNGGGNGGNGWGSNGGNNGGGNGPGPRRNPNGHPRGRHHGH